MLEQLRPGLLGRSGERLPFLGGLGLGVITLSVVLAASLRDPKSLDALESDGSVVAPGATGSASSLGAGPSAGSSATVETPPVELSPTNLLDAAKTGPELEKLAETFPRDPKVQRKLLLAYSDDPHALPQAVPVARRLLELDPTSAQDEAVRRIIFRGASGPPSIADTAFEAMQSGMGTSGADLLWDIASGGPTIAQAVKERALKTLADPKVRETMTPELKIAVDLKSASACQRKPLLLVAEKDADKRSLPFLEPLSVRRGCGVFNLGDCYECFGARTELTRTITAIRARSARPDPGKR